MTHQKPAGELSGGLFVFARGAMHRQLLPAADGEREFWKRPSPSRLRRATSPERERLWQRRKAYRLSADVFLPLTGEDETCPLCQGLHLRGRWHFAKRNDGRGSSWKQPSPSRLRRATSPERERLWQGRKVYRLTAGFFLPLTGEDETCPLCQGLSLRESCRRRRLRGFVLEAPLSPQATKRGASCRRRRLRGFVPKATLSVTASPCHLSRKGEALAGAKSLWAYKFASSRS